MGDDFDISLIAPRSHTTDVLAEAHRRQAAFRLAGSGICVGHHEQADANGICTNCGYPVIGQPEPSSRGVSPSVADFALGMLCGALLTLGCAALAYPFIT